MLWHRQIDSIQFEVGLGRGSMPRMRAKWESAFGSYCNAVVLSARMVGEIMIKGRVYAWSNLSCRVNRQGHGFVHWNFIAMCWDFTFKGSF